MAKFTEYGHGIEGECLSGDARRVEFKQGSLKKNPISGFLMVTYELDRNCTLSISRILEMTEDQKMVRDANLIHYEHGDTIIADATRLYIKSKRDCLSAIVKEGVTARHGSSLFDTPCHSIAVIKTPLAIYGNKLSASPSLKLLPK